MYFKDKHYYIAKVKEYAGMALSALVFDVIIIALLIM